MPQYVEVKGNVIEFPDGMPAPEIEKAIKANMLSIKPAAAVGAGKEINQIPRQVGLTARYGLEGLANTFQIATEPIRNAFNSLAASTNVDSPLAPTRREMPQMLPLGQAATNIANAAGLPSPQGANERVIGDATRLLAGSGGLAAAGRAATALPGMVGRAGELLSSNLPQQFASSVGAGLAGGASREAGGGELMQAGASLLGGVAAGSVPGLLGSVTNTGRTLLNKATMGPQQYDAQISAVLNRAGVDYSQLPAGVRNSLREEMRSALAANREMDPQAVARLADFMRVGATPTRGMVSQNPVQITREMNLAKMGANTGDDELQGLAMVQNRNNATLIRNLNDAGAAQGDPFRAGQAAIGSITSRDQAMGANVNQLYGNVRNMAGGDLPLDRKPFIDNIFGALQRENRMAFLPKELGDTLNSISSGQTPFTPQTVDMLKTMFATASRSSTDGNVRAAISIARNALDSTPVNLPPVGPGLATGQQASVLQGATTQANDVLSAMNQARQAAAQRFAWQESARPIEAALGGAQPDRFVRQFVIGGTVDDARAVAQNAPVDEVKNAIVAHLKERALNGSADEVGKFSQSAYNKALREIGERKLALFFSPEEVQQLNAVGRVASYAQVQPVGSAVNNSNSGALLLGRGYDMLRGVAGKLPLGQSLILDPLRNIEISVRANQAQNVLPGLLSPVPKVPLQERLLLPLTAGAGLLAAPQ